MARLMDNRGKVLFALENADQPFSVGSRFYFPPDIVFIFSLIVGIQYIDRFIVEHDESPTILSAFVGNAFNAMLIKPKGSLPIFVIAIRQSIGNSRV